MSKKSLMNKQEMIETCTEIEKCIKLYVNVENNNPFIHRTLRKVEDMQERIKVLKIA